MKVEIRNATEGIGKRMGGQRCRWRKETYLWDLGDGSHCRRKSSWTWILEILGSCSGGGRASVFLNKEGSGGATGKMPAEKKMEIFITFARGQNGDLTLCLFGRQRFI